MDRDGSVLSKLLLGFMHLADEVDEALPRFGYALFRPVGELELPHCSGLAILEKQPDWWLGWQQETDKPKQRPEKISNTYDLYFTRTNSVLNASIGTDNNNLFTLKTNSSAEKKAK